MTHTEFSKSNPMPRDTRIEKIFDKSARYALAQWNGDFADLNDLVQDLWVWYMERPAARSKLNSVKDYAAVNLVKRIAIQTLSGNRSADNEWYGYDHYSTKNVKDALNGKGNNPYLAEILPDAFKAIEGHNAEYAAALRGRYVDGVIPNDKCSQNKLVRAHKAIAEHVNAIAITKSAAVKDSDGPGSRSEVFPKPMRTGEDAESRRRRGEHSDPTANIAIMLMEHPELRNEYLREEPITEYTRGRGA